MVLRNVCILPHHYTASQPRRPRLQSSHKSRAMLSVCLCVTPFELLKKLTEFHEILYELDATGGYPNLIHLNCLHSVTTTWLTHELVSIVS